MESRNFLLFTLILTIVLVIILKIRRTKYNETIRNKKTLPDFLYLSDKIEYTKKLGENFFNYYNTLSNEFSPLIVDLYSEKAVFITKRYYPGLNAKEIVIQGTELKDLLKKSLPIAKHRNDTSSYRNLNFTINDEFIKIEGIRHSNLKNYDAEYYMIIKYENGILKIMEEFSESKPI